MIDRLPWAQDGPLLQPDDAVVMLDGDEVALLVDASDVQIPSDSSR
jgi:hypothetical protein